MNKKDIENKLEALSLDKNEYWVLAGSGLVMHGVRELTNDIDIGCTSRLFDALSVDHEPVKFQDDGSRSLVIDNIVEVFENWHVDEINEINNLPVASLLSIRKHKVDLGREKDLRDIKLIDVSINAWTRKVRYNKYI